MFILFLFFNSLYIFRLLFIFIFSFFLDRKQEFDFGGIDSAFNFYFAAFYCDCEHEVLPVTDGYRVNLVYNVVYTGKGIPPSISGLNTNIQDLSFLVKQWEKDESSKIFKKKYILIRNIKIKNIKFFLIFLINLQIQFF